MPGGLAGQLLERLAERPASIDELARASGVAPGEVAAALIELELAGRISEGDGVYRATIGAVRASSVVRVPSARAPRPIRVASPLGRSARKRRHRARARRRRRVGLVATARGRGRLPPDRSVAVIVVPAFDPGGVRRAGRGRPARARRGLDRLARAGARLPRPGPGRLVARRPRREPRSCGSRRRPPRRRSTSPCRRPGSHHNVVRYPVAIVGPGYHGLLTSASTRIDGLVSLADIAPTAAAIAAGKAPPIRPAPDADAAATLARLDARLARAHDARTGATLVLVGWLVALRRARHPRRSADRRPGGGARRAGGARGGAAPARASGVDDPTTVVVALAIVTGAGSLLLGAPARGARPCRRLLPRRVPRRRSRRGRRSTRWRRSGRIPTAAGGSTASRTRSRRCCSRRRSPLRRSPASQAPSRSGSCCSSPSGGAGPGRTEAGCSSSPRRSPCCSPASRGCGSRPPGSSLGVAASLAVGLAIVGVDALARRLEPRHRRRRRRPRHAVRRPRPAASDLVGGRDVGRAHGVPLPPLARRASPGSASGAASGRRSSRCSSAIGVSLVVNDTPVDVLGYGALGCLALTAWEETRAPRGAQRAQRGFEPPSRAARAPCALTERSSRTTPARGAVERGRFRRRPSRGSPRPSASTATSSSRCGSGRGGRARAVIRFCPNASTRALPGPVTMPARRRERRRPSCAPT